MELNITGKVTKVMIAQTGSGKKGAWVKQDFIIETSDQYPKTICFTAWGDLADTVSGLKPGQEVTVSFNPESREYNGKYYTDLKAWKIDTSFGGIEKTHKKEKLAKKEEFVENTEEDDLPF